MTEFVPGESCAAFCPACGVRISPGEDSAGACPRCGGSLVALHDGDTVIREGAANREDEDPRVTPRVRSRAGGPPVAGAERPGPPAPAVAPEPATPAGHRDTRPSAKFEVAPDDGSPVGRYRVIGRLGEGGMGVVMKAWDPALGRIVALKLIQVSEFRSPIALQRFQREARLAAQLRHPNIVAVHDVGSDLDVHFIAMDCVEGRTLDLWLRETRDAKRKRLPGAMARLREEVRVLADVAGAVGYAHAQGVIHRDLKPANVMLDHSGRACVLDFGLAKQVTGGDDEATHAANQVTASGDLLGTPLYMSPEQANGDIDRIGPRSDVWALGAMLYEVLVGESPYEGIGKAVHILYAVMHDDPAPPRKLHPAIPADLEAICLKALEKDPERRYASAGELEADLRRWLAGDAVAARRSTVTYRLWRKASRHQAWVVAAGVLFAALLGFGWAQVRAGRERAEADAARRAAETLHAEVLGQLRDIARLCVDETLAARRKGDLAPRGRLRPKLEAAVKRAQERLPEPSPEPDFLMGRMLRACQDEAGARAHQDRALGIDGEFAPAQYERAVLGARAYQRRLLEARRAALARAGARMGAASAPPAIPTAAELELGDAELRRERAETGAWLARLAAAAGGASPWREHAEPLLRVDAAKVGCARGLLVLFVEQDAAAAEAELTAAAEADATLEEAFEAAAQAALARGGFERALGACDRGIAADAGYVPHWMLRGAVRVEWRMARLARGEEPGELYDAAIADFVRAAELDPGRAEAWIAAAGARLDAGIQEIRHGGDPATRFTAAVADLERALAIEPGSAEAWRARGVIRSTWALQRMNRGEDSSDLFRAADADLSGAIERDPGDAASWERRGGARMPSAQLKSARGEDPGPAYAAAQADLRKAVELDPSRWETWDLLAVVQVNAGVGGLMRGQDPGEVFLGAVKDLDRALALDRKQAEIWTDRGQAWAYEAARLAAAGKDDEAARRTAVDDFAQAIGLRPDAHAAWEARGLMRYEEAFTRMQKGQDAGEGFEGAAADLGRALELRPDAAGRMRRAGLLSTWGQWRVQRGEDPTAAFEETAAEFGKALEGGAGAADRAEALKGRGGARANLGVWRQSQGQDPRAAFESAATDFAAALKLSPDQKATKDWLEKTKALLAGLEKK